ncbi:protein AF-9-like [Saccostrea echinata]|uniref:protein AF-9-like n=1 Tax=Saccostrea echinata TaxID=191078 RepID=UPI002A814A4A|nr:protein AF-9-like [Saccostrea echinata]
MNMSSQNCAVQVKIELGHRANVKKTPSPEGFTHDWTVYVRGPENCNISYFIEKVVFNLHHSFHNPKRVLTEPPYAVQEQGYAGFELPIDIYFKNKEDPKKIRFKYDLFLKLEDCPPVNHIRCEKLTFQNPTDEFKKKLLKAGGVLVGPTGEPMGQMGDFGEIFDAPISLDGSKKPKSSNSSKEKTSKEKSSSSIKSSFKCSAIPGTSSAISKDVLGIEDRKDKKSPKESSQQKRSHESSSLEGVILQKRSNEPSSYEGISQQKRSYESSSQEGASQQKRSYEASSQDGAVMKKPKRLSSVSSPSEVKVKEKHRSSEKRKHSKERDGSKSSKDSHKDHHRREVDSQEKDPRERDKEKLKREHKDRDGKKDLFKHRSSSSVTDSPNPQAHKSNSSEKKDKHSSKTSSDSSRKEIKQDDRKTEKKSDSSKSKRSENSHVRKDNKDDKSLSTSKSGSLKVDKKVKQSSKSSSKVPDTIKRPGMSTPETAPPRKKSKVEELFSSSEDESSEDEDEDVVKAIIENVERNIDKSESSSSSDSDLEDEVVNVWSSPATLKLSPLSQKGVTKSPSSVKNSSFHKTSRAISPASEKSWSSKYSPTGSTHSHTSTSHKRVSSKHSSKEKDISKHSKESKSQKSTPKSSHSSSEKKDKESSRRSEKHASKKSSTPSFTPNTALTEKAEKHSRSHSKERARPTKNADDKKTKDVKLLTDIKSEKIDYIPKSLEKTELKENVCKSENSKENFTSVKPEKCRTFSIESNEPNYLKKEYLSEDDDIDKQDNVTETYNFENGYGHLGTAPNGEDLIELLKLHEKLESMQDTSVIQRVVQEIEKTGLYKISEKTFDFDLCELDSTTVKKIHNFLCSV